MKKTCKDLFKLHLYGRNPKEIKIVTVNANGYKTCLSEVYSDSGSSLDFDSCYCEYDKTKESVTLEEACIEFALRGLDREDLIYIYYDYEYDFIKDIKFNTELDIIELYLF